MYIPLLGRLSVIEWPVIAFSLLLAWVEFIISVITRFLPLPVIDFCTATTQLLYRHTANPINLIRQLVVRGSFSDDMPEIRYRYPHATRDVDGARYQLMTGLLNSSNIHEMCLLFGYDVENRIVQTEDGYLLTLHRIAKKGPSPPRNGKVVYMHHGLLMSSEIWVTMLDRDHNLPFVLYELGYDVWMGNNRGNKYSQKHLVHKVNSERFWDFSIDEFALFDIPNSINHILSVTGAPSLTYIGFSQGTAQAFAALSVNHKLNDRVDRIIAISPATTPHGLYSKFLDIFLKSTPSIIYLMFSRKVLLPSVLFWQRIMYPPFFDTSIDMSNYLLFNWRSLNISKIQKLASYAHLYSTTSVKTVVHWFQIISSKNFQMYHDASAALSGTSPISYPLENVQIPIHLIYGDADSLVDINVMRSQLPQKYTTVHAVQLHEHLDNLWGEDVHKKVFRYVLQYLGEDGPTPSQILANGSISAGQSKKQA